MPSVSGSPAAAGFLARRPRRPALYTMAELVIVMLVAGILAAAALPAIDSALTNTRLQAAADQVQSVLLHARQRALATGQPVRVRIDPANATILVEEQLPAPALFDPAQTQLHETIVESKTFQPAARPERPGEQYCLSFATEPLLRQVQLRSVSLDANNQVTFDRRGRPAQNGTVELGIANNTIQISMLASSGQISSSQITP